MADRKLIRKPEIKDFLSDLVPDATWSFSHLSQKDTTYITHGYHRYPAKFIPQLAARLIENYSHRGEKVLDPFMGSGTTLVEARLLNRPSIGIDVNPVVHLIAQAKAASIEPPSLGRALRHLLQHLSFSTEASLFSDNVISSGLPEWPERLLYWFSESNLQAIYRIHQAVTTLEPTYWVFFQCALSHILKTVSYWSERSVKPTRDPNKLIPDPYEVFFRHVRRMERGNHAYWQLLHERQAQETVATCLCGDARQLPIHAEEIDLIVTSPPYVTSYEYADLHQLSVLWFGFADNLKSFREGFIGRSKGCEKITKVHSPLAEEIVAALRQINPSKASEVACYFSEMYESFAEWKRVLKPGGRAAIVIGNTKLSGVEIKNAQVFIEQLENLGFILEKAILREIPGKILPRTRDKKTGRFVRADEASYLAYPTEYILVVRRD